ATALRRALARLQRRHGVRPDARRLAGRLRPVLPRDQLRRAHPAVRAVRARSGGPGADAADPLSRRARPRRRADRLRARGRPRRPVTRRPTMTSTSWWATRRNAVKPAVSPAAARRGPRRPPADPRRLR